MSKKVTHYEFKEPFKNFSYSAPYACIIGDSKYLKRNCSDNFVDMYLESDRDSTIKHIEGLIPNSILKFAKEELGIDPFVTPYPDPPPRFSCRV